MNNMEDLKYIRRCFELAKKGEGSVSPNPFVGAVIVKDGKVISEGYHKKYGSPHAEADAISLAKQNLSGTTLYCNLEPCCHTSKQTPPCIPLIIKSGIKRVVISNLDPNPDVNGKGVQQLINAGIEVQHGVLAGEGEEVNRFYFTSVRTKLPYVTVKVAQSKDGLINSIKAERTRITSEEAEIFVHGQRASFDAVLVGANTINTDNPKLNVRKVKGKNPLRIILDGKLSSNIDANVFNDELKDLTWIFTSDKSDISKKDVLKKKGVRIFEIESVENDRLELKAVLAELYKNRVISVFVEGGAKIFSGFIENELFDELIILQAPIVIGEGIKAFGSDLTNKLHLKSMEQIGKDEKRVYRKIMIIK